MSVRATCARRFSLGVAAGCMGTRGSGSPVQFQSPLQFPPAKRRRLATRRYGFTLSGATTTLVSGGLTAAPVSDPLTGPGFASGSAGTFRYLQ